MVLLENKRQTLKVRLLFWFMVLVAALMISGGWAIFQFYGLSQADGGVLKPFGERTAFGGAVALFGIGAAAGMWLYISRYVVLLQREGGQVFITTLTAFGQRKRSYSIEQIGNSVAHDGKLQTRRANVNAPWMTLRVEGQKVPFILDMQAEIIQADKIRRLAHGR